MHVRIEYGPNHGIALTVEPNGTIRDFIFDARNREFLGYGDDISVTRNGMEVCLDSHPAEGDVYKVANRSGTKGN